MTDFFVLENGFLPLLLQRVVDVIISEVFLLPMIDATTKQVELVTLLEEAHTGSRLRNLLCLYFFPFQFFYSQLIQIIQTRIPITPSEYE